MKKFFTLFLLGSVLYAHSTTVTANDASYDGGTITLTGEVTIQNVMGKVEAARALLKRDPTCKIDFPWLELSGGVTAHLADGGVMRCERALFDYLKLRSDFLAPHEIHYEGPQGQIFASRAMVDYEERGEKIDPVKITLLGNVRLIRGEGEKQYALADHVEYFLKEERVVLKAQEGVKVLFFDLSKGMQLAATEVVAKRKEGKESVQGIGDVSFLFKQEELDQLKERFQWK